MSEQKLFTPDEVNRLIPRLTELMETAIERHGQALALQERLRDDRARVSASGGERRDAMDWKARAERLDGLGIEVRQILQDVQAMGGVVKDLETGLVDFPGHGRGGPQRRVWRERSRVRRRPTRPHRPHRDRLGRPDVVARRRARGHVR